MLNTLCIMYCEMLYVSTKRSSICYVLGSLFPFARRKGGVMCTMTHQKVANWHGYECTEERTWTWTWPGDLVGESCKHLPIH